LNFFHSVVYKAMAEKVGKSPSKSKAAAAAAAASPVKKETETSSETVLPPAQRW
jgi:hypothetical protein